MEKHPKDPIDEELHQMIDDTVYYDSEKTRLEEAEKISVDDVIEGIHEEQDEQLELMYPVLVRHGIFPRQLSLSDFKADILDEIAMDPSDEFHDFAYYAICLANACSRAQNERRHLELNAQAEPSHRLISDIQDDIASIVNGNPDSIAWIKASAELLGDDLFPIQSRDLITGNIEAEIDMLAALGELRSKQSYENHKAVKEAREYLERELAVKYGDHSEISDVVTWIVAYSAYRATVKDSSEVDPSSIIDTYEKVFTGKSIRVDYGHIYKLTKVVEAKLRQVLG